MTETLRDKLIQKGWVTNFNANTLVRLIEQHYKEQSLEVANYMKSQEELTAKRESLVEYMASVGPIMNDDELDGCLKDSYEVGEIACMFTEDEIGFLNECLDTIQAHHPGLKENSLVDVTLFESIEQKVTTLYYDYCVKYVLSPALTKYHELYGTWGTESDEEVERWRVFRDAFQLGVDSK